MPTIIEYVVRFRTGPHWSEQGGFTSSKEAKFFATEETNAVAWDVFAIRSNGEWERQPK